MVRIALAVYFRRIESAGAQNVAATGPMIMASNHPQSVTDALVLGLCSGRTLHYLAHSGLFRTKWKAWFLRHSGVIPVYRRHEVEDAADRNVPMFAACYRLMERGGAISIFPEGTSAEERRVRRLKTGAARIALESEQKNSWKLGVLMVPVGLNFESRRRIRSRVLASFGKPIIVAEYRQAYHDDPVATVKRLTSDLQQAIRRRVISIESSELEELARDLEIVYKGELMDREGTAIPGGSKFKRDQLVSREMLRALDYFYEYHPEVIWRMGTLLKSYRRKLDRFHLKDEMLRQEKGPTAIRETARFAARGAIGLPFALYGALWNFLPYKVTGWIAGRQSKDVTKIHLRQLLWGAFVYPLYYAPLVYAAYRLIGLVGAAVFAMTLPPTGIFARAYTRHMVRRRRMLRFAYLELQNRYFVQKLRQQRERLIEELDDAMEEYLQARGQDATGASPPLEADPGS